MLFLLGHVLLVLTSLATKFMHVKCSPDTWRHLFLSLSVVVFSMNTSTFSVSAPTQALVYSFLILPLKEHVMEVLENLTGQ